MPYKVLQVVNSLGMGGIEAFVTNVHKYMDSDLIKFDYCTIGSKPKDRLEDVKALGAEVFYYPVLSAKSFLSYQRWWKNFFRDHKDYIAVHGHVYTTASIYLLAAHNEGLKTISHSHSTGALKPNAGLFERELRKVLTRPLKKASWIDERLACSKDAGIWLYGNKKQFKIVKNAIELDSFKFSSDTRKSYRNSLGLEGSFVIGHIGRGHAVKNHEFLLRVFNEVHKKDSTSKLLLIGNLGMLEEQIREFIRNNRLDDAVIILGTRKDIPQLLTAMDLLCMPSKNEGLGITLIEAQTTGLPCVISDVIPEECDIHAGLITRCSLNREPAEWAELLLSKKTLHERRSYIKEAAEEGYLINNVADMMTDIYLKLADSGRVV